MTITPTSTREEKFQWLQRPLDQALTIAALCAAVSIGILTSDWESRFQIAAIWLSACAMGMTSLVIAAMFRMARAAGKL